MSDSPPKNLDHVNYDSLDRAKRAFIEAAQKTLTFAEKYGFLPDARLGASANVFALDLKPFLANSADKLFITLVPEGLGTADDARPGDLSKDELIRFWHNIGLKTVSCMTNDVASSGMQPILLSLYLPSADPEFVFNPEFMHGFLDGIVAGCRKVSAVYFSGETPQLKSKIEKGKLDIAGAVFGIVPPGREPIDGSKLSAGDKIVFIESSGPHENGFTSLRKLAEGLPQGYRSKLPHGMEYWEAINAPSHLYTPMIQEMISANLGLTNIEPISGHGWQKLMRSKKPLSYIIRQTLPVPEIFKFVAKASNSSVEEMIKIFNYGVGLALFIDSEKDAAKAVEIAERHNLKAVIAGETKDSKIREVRVEPFGVVLSSENFLLQQG